MAGSPTERTGDAAADDADRRRAERRVELLSVFARQGIIAEFDSRCRYVDVWAADDRLLVKPTAELIGKTIAEAMGDAIGAPLMAGTRRVYETGVAETFEYALPLALGTRTFEAQVVRIAVEGGPEPHRAAALIRDVTDQRNMEKKLAEAERLAALGVLAAGVGHEINNPLMVVRENVRLAAQELEQLARRPDPALADAARPVRDMLEDVLLAVRRIESVVADLRLFRREDDRALAAVDVRAVLRGALAIAEAEIRQRALLECDLSPVPPVTAGDTQLYQVFFNLLINATQAIQEGEPRSQRIRAATRTDERGWAVVEIRDTGCGIPAVELGRIFEPFYTTKREGMGLGLSVCHRIIAGYGGTIAVESELGRGTTFRVSLPPRAAAAEGAPPPAPAARGPAPSRMRILAVDDEPALLHVLSRLLGGSHEVTTASGRDEALEVLRRDAGFDCILCDLMMPLGDGMSFYERLRDAWPGLERRVVFMTGGAFTEKARSFLHGVPNATLEKPFDRATLDRVLADLAAAG